MALFERADTGKRVTWWSLLGLILVPAIIAAGFAFAAANSSQRMGSVKAAIVNNDDGAEVDGETVPMGRQLSAALVDQDGDNFDWVQSTDEDAAEGIEDGTYAAVVTIPAGFSAAVLSTANEVPANTVQAEIAVESSRVSPISESAVAQALIEAARAKFNTDMTEQFLDGVFVGFNEMGDQFQTMEEAAGELDDGATQLSDGIGELAAGSGQLADGLKELDENSDELVDGVRQLGDGASQLSDGVSKLDDGATQLSDGLQTMKKQTKDLPDQSQQLADGASDLSDGVDEYTKNVDGIVTGVSDFADKLEDIDFDQLEQLASQVQSGGSDPAKQLGDVQDFLDGVSSLSEGISAYQDSLRDSADRAEGSIGKVTRFDQAVSAGMMTNSQAKQLRSQLCGQLPDGADDDACPVVEAGYMTGYLQGLSTGLDQAADGLDEKDSTTGQSIAGGAASLGDAADGISGQIDDALAQLRSLEDLGGLGSMTGDMSTLKDQLQKFQDTSDQFLDGSQQLRDGASQLADGNQQFADGMDDLADGIGQSADGARSLSDGTGQLADGADQLADGAGQLDSGVRQYTGAVGLIADNVDTLVGGIGQLAKGSDELADGMGRFADGLAEGKDQIPSYTATDRDQLKTVASNSIDDPYDGFTTAYLGQVVALMLILALWVGSLVTYMVIRAVSAKALTSRRSSIAIMARGLVPGLGVSVLQALAVTGLAQVLLKLPSFDASHLFVFSLFAGLVFTVLNFALTALLGSVGRIISLFAIVTAVGARLFSGVPEVLSSLAAAMPPNLGIEGVLSIVTGTPGTTRAWGMLLLWLILGLGLSLLAVARRRSLKPAEIAQLV